MPIGHLVVIAITLVVIALIVSRSYRKHKPLKSSQVLAAIVCIDRDVDLAPMLYEVILANGIRKGGIIIVTRDSDEATIDFWQSRARVVTVPHYDIDGRHNYAKIAHKRSIVMEFAKSRGYPAVWFIDSDIIPDWDILRDLMKTREDICFAPYRVKWAGCAVVGKRTWGYKLYYVPRGLPASTREACAIGGFGCTLVRASTYEINIEYLELEDASRVVFGEDIGFFVGCARAGLTCEYLPGRPQLHLYDREILHI